MYADIQQPCILHFDMCTLYFTIYSCMSYRVRRVKCTPYIVRRTLYVVLCSPYVVRRTLYVTIFQAPYPWLHKIIAILPDIWTCDTAIYYTGCLSCLFPIYLVTWYTGNDKQWRNVINDVQHTFFFFFNYSEMWQWSLIKLLLIKWLYLKMRFTLRKN